MCLAQHHHLPLAHTSSCKRPLLVLSAASRTRQLPSGPLPCRMPLAHSSLPPLPRCHRWRTHLYRPPYPHNLLNLLQPEQASKGCWSLMLHHSYSPLSPSPLTSSWTAQSREEVVVKVVAWEQVPHKQPQPQRSSQLLSMMMLQQRRGKRNKMLKHTSRHFKVPSLAPSIRPCPWQGKHLITAPGVGAPL